MNKSDFAFTKLNYILLGVGIAIIVLGFILMAGDGSSEKQFNPEIFSDTRIKVAPLVTLFGFVFIIAAILVKTTKKTNEPQVQEPKTEE